MGTRPTPEVMLRTTSALSTKEFTKSNDDDEEETESDDVIDTYDYDDEETTNSLNGNRNKNMPCNVAQGFYSASCEKLSDALEMQFIIFCIHIQKPTLN